MPRDMLTARLPLGDRRTRYVLETVLRDGAGLPLVCEEHARADVSLSVGESGDELRLAAADQPSSSVDTLLRRSPGEVDAIDMSSPEGEALCRGPLLSALFHVLAGSEEVKDERRDGHERFAASMSRLFAAGYDNAPFVDLWADAVVRQILSRWHSIEQRPGTAQLEVSHDVDAPFRYRFQSPIILLRSAIADATRGQWWRAIGAPWRWAQVRAGATHRDPYDHFGWMMDQAEAVGTRCTFYVIAGHSGGRIDGDYDLYHPVMLRLWEQILDRGHRIGVHPSYNSFRSLELLKQERERVIGIYERLGERCESPRVRMHYLRFDPLVTPGLLAAAGFTHDSTLGFADRSGFRRGTCRPFKLWDHMLDQPLELVEHPLLAMDATLLADRYENLDQTSVERRIGDLAHWCERFGGNLTLLWHNNYYEQDWHFAAYRSALRSLPAKAAVRGAAA